MNIEDFPSANQAINTWLMSGDTASLTEEVRAHANQVLSTPVMPQRVSQFPELVYANADAFSPAARSLAADLCDFASSLGFFGLGDDLRGTRISAVLRGAELDEAPAPKPEYLIEPVA
jgi:hypothetical protein